VGPFYRFCGRVTDSEIVMMGEKSDAPQRSDVTMGMSMTGRIAPALRTFTSIC
jgi:hypothetical protein